MNTQKRIGDKIITRTALLGGVAVFEAYEPSAVMGKHHVITTFDGAWYGQIGSRFIPAEIEALRGGSPERLAACDAYRAAQRAEAYALIREAFPEAAGAPDDTHGFELRLEPRLSEQFDRAGGDFDSALAR